MPERGLRITEAELERYRRVKSYQIISSIINTDIAHLTTCTLQIKTLGTEFTNSDPEIYFLWNDAVWNADVV